MAIILSEGLLYARHWRGTEVADVSLLAGEKSRSRKIRTLKQEHFEDSRGKIIRTQGERKEDKKGL